MNFIRSLDPKLFYALVAGLTWLVLYVWRRISIASWDAVTKKSPALQQLPALVLSALMSAAPAIGKGVGDVVQQVLLGVLFGGGGAALLHNLPAASPLPYTGNRKPEPGAAPPLLDTSALKKAPSPTSEEITADDRPTKR